MRLRSLEQSTRCHSSCDASLGSYNCCMPAPQPRPVSSQLPVCLWISPTRPSLVKIKSTFEQMDSRSLGYESRRNITSWIVRRLTTGDPSVFHSGDNEITVLVGGVSGFVIHTIRGYESVLPGDDSVSVSLKHLDSINSPRLRDPKTYLKGYSFLLESKIRNNCFIIFFFSKKLQSIWIDNFAYIFVHVWRWTMFT